MTTWQLLGTLALAAVGLPTLAAYLYTGVRGIVTGWSL